jgi:hypothetical protein
MRLKIPPVFFFLQCGLYAESPPLKKSKSLPEAPPTVQQFVRSAERNFLAYEQKKKLAVGDSQEKSAFLEVCGDPLGNLPTETGYLIWIRKCYEDLMSILVGAKEGLRFIFRGTAGVGKSLFTLVWISYLATRRKKVVLKSTSDTFYLLDFTLAEAKAFGPFLHVSDLALGDVLYDSTAWLILDGRQGGGLEFPCHMLLACSNKKANYHEFAKNPKSSVRYVPVWTEEEVEEFLVDFKPHRCVYGHMSVPDDGIVMENFRLFGGVPRCVFDRARSDSEKLSMMAAIEKLDMDTCLKLFAGAFGDEYADKLVHMKCLDDTYCSYQYDFASKCVLDKIWQQLLSMAKLDTVRYLEKLLRNPSTGAAFGSIFELVAHSLVAKGGNFKRKKVCKDGKPEAIDDLELGKMDRKVFEKLDDLRKFKDGDYCEPMKTNLQSVDAVILPDILLQFFHYTQGNHGYKIKGLQDLDDVLKKPRYRLFSCVPADTYESTGFQNFLDAKGNQVSTGYNEKLQRKMDQYVVMVDFRRYSDL